MPNQVPPEIRGDWRGQGANHRGYLRLSFLDAVLTEIDNAEAGDGDHSFERDGLADRHQTNVIGGATTATCRSGDVVPNGRNAFREFVHVHQCASRGLSLYAVILAIYRS